MWLVSSLQVVSRSFDFGSSGQATHQDLGLHADGHELANMLRLVDWDDNPVQLLLCEACGTVGCASGGYVAPRRLGPYVVLAPSTEAPEGGSVERQRHFDHLLLRKRRQVPLIPVEEWKRLRMASGRVPDAEGFPPLSWDEAFLIAQYEAPHRLLGEPGQLLEQPLSQRVVATDPWLEPGTLERLGTVDEWSQRTGTPRLVREGYERISVVLEEPLDAVELFAKDFTGIGLYFRPGIALLCEP
jgi:hypothetical protein